MIKAISLQLVLSVSLTHNLMNGKPINDTPSIRRRVLLMPITGDIVLKTEIPLKIITFINAIIEAEISGG
jgi:hypothetical protein